MSGGGGDCAMRSADDRVMKSGGYHCAMQSGGGGNHVMKSAGDRVMKSGGYHCAMESGGGGNRVIKSAGDRVKERQLPLCDEERWRSREVSEEVRRSRATEGTPP
eukprot:5887094-Pleurochrysis_carterae.AAC.1